MWNTQSEESSDPWKGMEYRRQQPLDFTWTRSYERTSIRQRKKAIHKVITESWNLTFSTHKMHPSNRNRLTEREIKFAVTMEDIGLGMGMNEEAGWTGTRLYRKDRIHKPLSTLGTSAQHSTCLHGERI